MTARRALDSSAFPGAAPAAVTPTAPEGKANASRAAGGGTHIVLFILPLSFSSGSLRRRPPRSMRPCGTASSSSALGIGIAARSALRRARSYGPAGGRGRGRHRAGLRVLPSLASWALCCSTSAFSPLFCFSLLPPFLEILRRVTPPKGWLSFPSVRNIPCSSGGFFLRFRFLSVNGT